MNIMELNRSFGIANKVVFVEGQGRLPFIQIDTDKAQAVISVYAGQVLSFKPVNQKADLMFLSTKAYYQAGKAIKGGVPICWPWFGADPEGKGRPAHGFVRNRMWEVIDTQINPSNEVRVVLGLNDTPETLAIWPYSFKLRLEITISDTLNLELITQNTGDQAFTITQAFHTYFSVQDIHQVSVAGLNGKPYLDKVDGGQQKTQLGEVKINAEVDRIYLNVSNDLTIHDAGMSRQILIRAKGSQTAVVWNPWEKISKEMADLLDDDYLRLICVETTNAATDTILIQPGNQFSLVARYQVG